MENTAKSFEDLIVWKKAHQLVLDIYKATMSYPKDELYGIVQQFRRAAVSIAANIAEGFRKHGVNDKIRFYNIAEGSLEECRYYLILSRDLGYLQLFDELWMLSDEVRKLLLAYTRVMREKEGSR
jgi:four helix bundle protein